MEKENEKEKITLSETERLDLFKNELQDIKDDNLRNFMKEIIKGAPDYFFEIPASTSGKYHPKFDLGQGGLIRHSRCVEFFARSIAESLCFSERKTDLLIISALSHDIQKMGDGSTGHTVWEHPTKAASYVFEMYMKHQDLIGWEDTMTICDAINSHMGKWEHSPEFCKNRPPLPLPKTEFEKALQCADYIASRKEILDFKFRD